MNNDYLVIIKIIIFNNNFIKQNKEEKLIFNKRL